MLQRLGLAATVVLALYMLVTLIRGAPGGEFGSASLPRQQIMAGIIA